VIAEHLATWDTPFVELAIYGTSDAAVIAAQLDALARRVLGSQITGARFCNASFGSVSGVVLADGREVVIKVYQPRTAVTQLAEQVRIRGHLAISPRVLAGPVPIAHGHATIEVYADGTWRDPHEPATRRLVAHGLHTLVEACRPLVATSSLEPLMFSNLPDDQLWPTPHSKLFHFAATAAGAEWIDDVARAARAVPAAGELVIGHADWRAEHLRFEGESISVAYDWDSLARDREPALVGISAHAFAADWSRQGRAQAPTLDEARAYVADYEQARGRGFEPDERRALAASFAFTCAYTARCGHALGARERDVPGTFQHLVAQHGVGLLQLSG